MKTLPTVLLTALIVGAPLGYYAYSQSVSIDELSTQKTIAEETLNAQQEKAAEPLTISTDIDFEKTDVTFDDYWTAESLKIEAEQECSAEKKPDGYFADLVHSFDGTSPQGYKYTFTEGTATHIYLVFKNVPQYKQLADFQKDFAVCAVGAEAYPHRMNQDWLLFSETWGGGAAITEEQQKAGDALSALQKKLEAQGVIELN